MGVPSPRLLPRSGMGDMDRVRAAVELHHHARALVAAQPSLPLRTWQRPHIDRENVYRRSCSCSACGELTLTDYITCRGDPRDHDPGWRPFCRTCAPKGEVGDEVRPRVDWPL
jgi:hypothetical protein